MRRDLSPVALLLEHLTELRLHLAEGLFLFGLKVCKFPGDRVTDVYYPVAELFKPSKAEELTGVASVAEIPIEAEEEEI